MQGNSPNYSIRLQSHCGRFSNRKPAWYCVCFVCASFLIVFVGWWMGGHSSRSAKMAQPAVVVNATAKHTASVIFLHGLGDTGLGWSQAFASIRAPHIKYVCPTAQSIPVTLNNGFKMPSWFDIKGLSPGSDEDEAGIIAAAELLQTYIKDEENKGIPRSRIIVGGFSQGGAVALYSSFALKQDPVAGILALSSWMPLHKTFPQALKANQATPILQCHGEADPMVPFAFGDLTAKLLKSFNSKHVFKSYKGMGHSSSPEEMQEVQSFITQQLL